MIIAIIVAALIVLVVILQLLGVGGGMGGHGPGRHLGAALLSVPEASAHLS
jgi:hypothetical protein